MSLTTRIGLVLSPCITTKMTTTCMVDRVQRVIHFLFQGQKSNNIFLFIFLGGFLTILASIILQLAYLIVFMENFSGETEAHIYLIIKEFWVYVSAALPTQLKEHGSPNNT